MKIVSIRYQNISFGSNRKKFDVQGHVGSMYDGITKRNAVYNSRDLIDVLEPNNVKKILVSSLSALNDKGSDLFQSEFDSGKEMKNIKGNSRLKIYPLISCQPGISKDTNVIDELTNKGKFYGMKFHPTNTGKSLQDNFEIYSEYMTLAEHKGLPCVFHSAADGKSDPMQIIKLAEQHPAHPVVLYHINLAASAEQMSKTIDNIANSVKNGKSNLFVDVSWLTNLWDKTDENKSIIKQALEKIGYERILFGSDAPITEMGDKDKYARFADFVENTVKEFYSAKPEEGEKALNRILYDNAEELFIEKKWYHKPFKKAAGSFLKIPKSVWITTGIAVLGGIIAMTMSKDKPEKLKDRPSRVIKH